MRSRSFFVVLLGVVFALLSVGIGGFYLLVLHNSSTQVLQAVKPIPEAIMFVPRRSPLMVSMQVSPETIEAYEQSGLSASDRRSLHQQFNQFKHNLLEGTGIRYTRDIRPWLGNEITGAIVTSDLDRNSVNGQQPGYLLALSIQNPFRAQRFLQEFWETRSLAGHVLKSEPYAGVDIITDDTLATARFDDRFILVSNSAKVLRQSLNAVQVPEYSLRSSESVTDAIQQLLPSRIGLVYTSNATIQDVLAPRSMAVDEKSVLSDSGLVVAIALDAQGLRLEGQDLALLPDRPIRDELTEEGVFDSLSDVLQYVPDGSIMAMLGTNPASLFESQLEFPQRLLSTRLQPWRDRWQPVFAPEGSAPVMGGYALALLEVVSQPEWIFVAHPVMDGAAAADEAQPTSVIDRLNQIGTEQGLNVVTLPLGDRTVTAWTRIASSIVPVAKQKPLSAVTEDVVFDADIEGVYAMADNLLLVASSPEAMNAAFNATVAGNDGLLQRALQALPSAAATGYVYLDGRSLRMMLDERFDLGDLFARTQPLSGAIQSIILGRDRTAHDIGLIQLQLT